MLARDFILCGVDVQIFGLKKSQATRAAERFFKERKIKLHMVDLNDRAIAPGELKRFTDKLGLNAVLDITGKAYTDAGLEYLRVTDEGMISKIILEPRLLLLPLVRCGKLVSAGLAESVWKSWLE